MAETLQKLQHEKLRDLSTQQFGDHHRAISMIQALVGRFWENPIVLADVGLFESVVIDLPRESQVRLVSCLRRYVATHIDSKGVKMENTRVTLPVNKFGKKSETIIVCARSSFGQDLRFHRVAEAKIGNTGVDLTPAEERTIGSIWDNSVLEFLARNNLQRKGNHWILVSYKDGSDLVWFLVDYFRGYLFAGPDSVSEGGGEFEFINACGWGDWASEDESWKGGGWMNLTN
jgi:hypothetical protein